ncbi:hypothetical protein V8E54_008942 [Elaphomyces granulatus]
MTQDMFPSKRDSQASSQTAEPSTSHPLYRALLHGDKIPPPVRTLINENILKDPSLPLSEESVREVRTMAKYLVESAEASVSSLIRTPIYPMAEALPHNYTYGPPVSAPKPDLHYGYAPGQLSTWSLKENAVADHLKSEATGGTLWHAENQAAGSGTCCVSGLLWLLKEAAPDKTRCVTDSIAFSVTATQRATQIYVHYYVEEEQRFYMSFVDKIWNTDLTCGV